MITIQDLRFGYSRQHLLFDSLSLSLNAGSITGLFGKNGAGKTSLLKLVTGLLSPSAGSVHAMSHEPRKRDPSFLSRVYFVPEEFFVPSVSFKAYVKANSPFYPSFDHALFSRLLGEFEISEEDVLDKVSFGQRKKFMISFALATRCRLLILDEPTNGLDIPSKAIFRRVVAGALDSDQLVLISTHQVRDVESLVDRLLILDRSRIALDKDLHDISSQLHFATAQEVDEHALYSEVAPGGYKVIMPQRNGSSSVDIELLFNAVTQGKNLL